MKCYERCEARGRTYQDRQDYNWSRASSVPVVLPSAPVLPPVVQFVDGHETSRSTFGMVPDAQIQTSALSNTITNFSDVQAPQPPQPPQELTSKCPEWGQSASHRPNRGCKLSLYVAHRRSTEPRLKKRSIVFENGTRKTISEYRLICDSWYTTSRRQKDEVLAQL